MRNATVAAVLAGILAGWGFSSVPAAPLEVQEITRLKPMYLETPLVANGQASCVIVPPDDPAYLPLARKLAEAIGQACGVLPPVQPSGEVARSMPPRENLIALGIFANNRVVEDLYFRQFVLCDYAWPGGKKGLSPKPAGGPSEPAASGSSGIGSKGLAPKPAGGPSEPVAPGGSGIGSKSYVIRTVHNPWLNGKNVIYLGSATVPGCQAAVDRFIQMLAGSRKGSVGPIIEVVCDGQSPKAPAEKEIAGFRRQIERAVAQDRVYGWMAQCSDNYFLTGQPAWGRLFLEAVRKIDQLHRTQSDMATPSNCQHVFKWFDCIEEGSAFSDEERLELTNLLCRFAARLSEAKTVLTPLARSAGNHAFTAASAALYFSRYYPDLELSKRLLANMETYYEPDMTAWKPPEDSPRYGNITTVRSFRWAFERPDRRYLDNGLLRRIADYDMLITNNLGRMCGIGDYSGLERGTQLVEVYPLAAWLYRDGRYLWWWDHFAKDPTAPGAGFYRGRGHGLIGWVPPEVLPRKRPDDLLGIARAPLDRWIYDRRDVAAYFGWTYGETHRIPIEACYDKVAFRAGFDPDDQYLCLSGFGYGYHSHPHANAIVNYADRGQTRLYDDGYMVAQPSEHNTVIVLKEGWMGGIPELAQALAQADFPGVGLFVSRLNDYSGVDWDRAILWPKSRYFLVIDTLRAKESGHYSFQCIWRALGKTDLRGRRWESVNPPGRFHLVACSDTRLAQKPSAGADLNAPPFPPDKARRLVESSSARLRPGESRVMANLFYSTPDTGPTRQVNLCRLGETAAYLVEDDGRLALAGVGRSDTLPECRIEAEAFHLLGTTLTAAAAKLVRVGALSLAAEPPIHVQLDLRTGEASVEAAAVSRIALATATEAQTTERLEPGARKLKLRPASDAILQSLAREMQSSFARLSAAAPDADKARDESGLRIQQLWQYRAAAPERPADAAGESPHPNAVRVADVDGDGRDEVFVAGLDNAVHALAADGRRLWRHPFLDVIDDLNVSPVAGAGRQVWIGCDDNRVSALRADGSIAWSALPPPKSYARPGYHEGDPTVHQGKPVVVFGADLHADGKTEVIVGVNNGFVYMYDETGKLMWDALSHTPHSMTCGAACDLDGDGRKEIVVGNIYGSAHILSCDGKRFGGSCGTGHAGAVVVAAADIDGDGKGEIAVGDKFGRIFLQKAPPQGEWSGRVNTEVYNTGSDVTSVAMGDLNGDGKLETAAASKNFLLYLFDAQRKPLWHVNLGDACMELDVADVTGDGLPEIICACEDGTVQVVDAAGKVIARYRAPAAVRSIRACELDGKTQTKEIVASCEDGSVCALQVAK